MGFGYCLELEMTDTKMGKPRHDINFESLSKNVVKDCILPFSSSN